MKDAFGNTLGMIWMLAFWPLVIGLTFFLTLNSVGAFAIIFIILLVIELIISGIVFVNLLS